MIPKDGDGPENPTVIALAVGDTSGRCAGAVLYGFPKTDKVMKIASPSPCTAQGIVAAFKVAFTGPSQVATPTAVAAPKPPATGSGADQGEGRKVPLFAVALAMLGGATFLAVRFRRA